MTAIDQLAEFYKDDPERFASDLDAHILHAYAYITPTALALARPVSVSWTQEQLANPWPQTGLTCAPDCWYVWAAIGDLKHLMSLIPYPLPFIAFSRRGKPIKPYPFARFNESAQASRRSKPNAARLFDQPGGEWGQPRGETPGDRTQGDRLHTA